MHPSRKPVMAANWKMYKTIGEAKAFFDSLNASLGKLSQSDLPDIVVCPPYTALEAASCWISDADSPVGLGAQNMESRDEGAYTGEISPKMLLDVDVQYVVIGHSERRQYYNETDASVNAKTKAALAHGLTAIVCIGETLEEREAGQTDAVVSRQLEQGLDGISPTDRAKLIFAYEPVWAIGTGKVCESDEAGRVCGVIRQVIGVPECRVLYGGSVKPDNVAGLMAQPDIDGGLVGGASLQPDSFLKLIEAAMPVKV